MRMKLYEAIMTGAGLMEKTDPGSWCGCAIGMALAALNGKQLPLRDGNIGWFRAVKEWPVLQEFVPIPSVLFENDRSINLLVWGLTPSRPGRVEQIISCAYSLVHHQKMSLESLVDMVRDIESHFPYPVEQQTTPANLEPEPVY